MNVARAGVVLGGPGGTCCGVFKERWQGAGQHLKAGAESPLMVGCGRAWPCSLLVKCTGAFSSCREGEWAHGPAGRGWPGIQLACSGSQGRGREPEPQTRALRRSPRAEAGVGDGQQYDVSDAVRHHGGSLYGWGHCGEGPAGLMFCSCCCKILNDFTVGLQMLMGLVSQVAVLVVKNSPANAADIKIWVQSLGREDPLEEGMGTHSSILTWGIHGQRSLADYSPWGQESRT